MMSLIDVVRSYSFSEPLGWTIVHFIWQGAVIVGATMLLLVMTPAHRANRRYLICCGAMLLTVIAPIVTFFIMWRTPGGEALTDQLAALVAAAPVTQTAWDRLTAHLPDLAAVWMLGTVLFHLRAVWQWGSAQRLRRLGTRPAPRRWQANLDALRDDLGVSRAVNLLSSARVTVPLMIGWMRPVILMPVGAFTGLTTEQLRAVLAHELAHVRRHDYLINLAQVFVESLLFFHPAVWWLSHRMRVEREYCCDDVAVRVCGDPLCYAQALSALDRLRDARDVRTALASTGGSLMDRICRLVGTRPRTVHRPTGRGFSLVLTTSLLVGVSGVSLAAATSAATSAAECPPDADAVAQGHRELLELVEQNPDITYGEIAAHFGDPFIEVEVDPVAHYQSAVTAYLGALNGAIEREQDPRRVEELKRELRAVYRELEAIKRELAMLRSQEAEAKAHAEHEAHAAHRDHAQDVQDESDEVLHQHLMDALANHLVHLRGNVQAAGVDERVLEMLHDDLGAAITKRVQDQLIHQWLKSANQRVFEGMDDPEDGDASFDWRVHIDPQLTQQAIEQVLRFRDAHVDGDPQAAAETFLRWQRFREAQDADRQHSDHPDQHPEAHETPEDEEARVLHDRLRLAEQALRGRKVDEEHLAQLHERIPEEALRHLHELMQNQEHFHHVLKQFEQVDMDELHEHLRHGMAAIEEAREHLEHNLPHLEQMQERLHEHLEHRLHGAMEKLHHELNRELPQMQEILQRNLHEALRHVGEMDPETAEKVQQQIRRALEEAHHELQGELPRFRQMLDAELRGALREMQSELPRLRQMLDSELGEALQQQALRAMEREVSQDELRRALEEARHEELRARELAEVELHRARELAEQNLHHAQEMAERARREAQRGDREAENHARQMAEHLREQAEREMRVVEQRARDLAGRHRAIAERERAVAEQRAHEAMQEQDVRVRVNAQRQRMVELERRARIEALLAELHEHGVTIEELKAVLAEVKARKAKADKADAKKDKSDDQKRQ